MISLVKKVLGQKLNKVAVSFFGEGYAIFKFISQVCLSLRLHLIFSLPKSSCLVDLLLSCVNDLRLLELAIS